VLDEPRQREEQPVAREDQALDEVHVRAFRRCVHRVEEGAEIREGVGTQVHARSRWHEPDPGAQDVAERAVGIGERPEERGVLVVRGGDDDASVR